MVERREAKRLGKSLFVRFDAKTPDRAIQHGSFTHDVSLGGVCLLSPVALPEQTALMMNIDIPNDPEMAQAEGQVRWVGRNSIFDENGARFYPLGVEFTFLDRQDRVYLRNFLEQR